MYLYFAFRNKIYVYYEIFMNMKIEIHPDARALIFDIDGTLADTMSVHFNCWSEILKSKNVDYTKEVFYKYAGMPTADTVVKINEHYGINLDVEKTTNDKEKAYISNINKIKPIIPSFELVLEYYNKLPIAAGTGSYRYIAELNLKAIDVYQYIDVLVTADDIKKHKPHPETFLKCAELLNVEPKYCQVFEDAELGFRAVKSAGMILTDINMYL